MDREGQDAGDWNKKASWDLLQARVLFSQSNCIEHYQVPIVGLLPWSSSMYLALLVAFVLTGKRFFLTTGFR